MAISPNKILCEHILGHLYQFSGSAGSYFIIFHPLQGVSFPRFIPKPQHEYPENNSLCESSRLSNARVRITTASRANVIRLGPSRFIHYKYCTDVKRIYIEIYGAECLLLHILHSTLLRKIITGEMVLSPRLVYLFLF